MSSTVIQPNRGTLKPSLLLIHLAVLVTDQDAGLWYFCCGISWDVIIAPTQACNAAFWPPLLLTCLLCCMLLVCCASLRKLTADVSRVVQSGSASLQLSSAPMCHIPLKSSRGEGGNVGYDRACGGMCEERNGGGGCARWWEQ